MKPRPWTIYWALSVCASFVTVAGCGALQPPIGASPGSSRIIGAPSQVQSATSWMLPEAKSEDLIYTSDISQDKVFVLSFPAGNLVRTLDFSDLPWGLCSDSVGHVFVTHFPYHGGNGVVTEYAHGGSTPIATRNLLNAESGTCSVDPTNRNLAVIAGPVAPSGNLVYIFSLPLEKGVQPRTINAPPALIQPYSAYDNRGNLFLSFSDDYPRQENLLAEIPAGASTLLTIYVRAGRMGPIQWHRAYLAEGNEPVNHIKVSGTFGQVVGATRLARAKHLDFDEDSFWIEDHEIIAPFKCQQCQLVNKLGVWTYPGGSLIKIIGHFGAAGLDSITISRASKLALAKDS
jgi:hypothetical protein